MIVVDAGVVVSALIGSGTTAEAARHHLLGGSLAPELVDLEVGSVLRRLATAGRVSTARAEAALRDLQDLPLERASHRPFLARCWALRGSVTFYDAVYVALAEAAGTVLLTTDRRLTTAPGPRCEVQLLT